MAARLDPDQLGLCLQNKQNVFLQLKIMLRSFNLKIFSDPYALYENYNTVVKLNKILMNRLCGKKLNFFE